MMVVESEQRPRQKRSAWSKILNLAFRVGHIGVGSLLLGGLFWHQPFAGMLPWHRLTIGTGLLLIGSGIWQSRHWIYQGRGLLALFHVALVWPVHLYPAQMRPALMTVLAVGVIGSHLPGSIRHWSLLHRRRID